MAKPNVVSSFFVSLFGRCTHNKMGLAIVLNGRDPVSLLS